MGDGIRADAPLNSGACTPSITRPRAKSGPCGIVITPIDGVGLAIAAYSPFPNTSDWRLSGRYPLAPELCELAHKVLNYISSRRRSSSEFEFASGVEGRPGNGARGGADSVPFDRVPRTGLEAGCGRHGLFGLRAEVSGTAGREYPDCGGLRREIQPGGRCGPASSARRDRPECGNGSRDWW